MIILSHIVEQDWPKENLALNAPSDIMGKCAMIELRPSEDITHLLCCKWPLIQLPMGSGKLMQTKTSMDGSMLAGWLVKGSSVLDLDCYVSYCSCQKSLWSQTALPSQQVRADLHTTAWIAITWNAWSANLLSACFLSVMKGHNWLSDYLSVTLFCHGQNSHEMNWVYWDRYNIKFSR